MRILAALQKQPNMRMRCGSQNRFFKSSLLIKKEHLLIKRSQIGIAKKSLLVFNIPRGLLAKGYVLALQGVLLNRPPQQGNDAGAGSMRTPHQPDGQLYDSTA